MKKITLAILAVLFSLSTVSAEMGGFRLGVSGNVGLYETSGKEVENGETNTAKTEEALAGMGSVFVEVSLSRLPGPLGRLSLGYDQVIHDIKTGTSSRTETDKIDAASGFAAQRGVENTASATISNMNTLYLTANLTDEVTCLDWKLDR